MYWSIFYSELVQGVYSSRDIRASAAAPLPGGFVDLRYSVEVFSDIVRSSRCLIAFTILRSPALPTSLRLEASGQGHAVLEARRPCKVGLSTKDFDSCGKIGTVSCRFVWY